MKKYIIATLILMISRVILFDAFLAQGQNSTNSPYSMFGVGKLESTGTMRTQALGGTGYGLNTGDFINRLNPAALTSLDSCSFYYDFGFHLDYNLQDSQNGESEIYDGNFQYLTFAFPITRGWYASFGLEPLSSIGYDVSTERIVEGTADSYMEYFQGLGGLNKFYLGSGWKINDNLSLGGNAAFVWGAIEDLNTAELSSGGVSGIEISRKDYYHGFQFDLGVQWSIPLKNKTTLTLGGISSISTDLVGNTELYGEQYNLDGSATDSLFTDEDIISSIQFPVVLGGGFSLDFNDRYILAGDYTFSNWETVDFEDNNGGETVNNHVFSLGFEKVKNRYALKYWERVNYRFGARYESGYQRIDGLLIDDLSLSLGVGLPIKNSKSYMNFNLKAGQRGTIQKGLIRERYLEFGVSFSFHDRWFVKQKYN